MRSFNVLARLAREIRDTALEALLPAVCPSCREGLPGSSPGGICPACWNEVPVHAGRACVRCDLPFPADPGGMECAGEDGTAGPARAEVCAACRTDPPPFSMLRAAAPYTGRMRRILKVFKFHDQPGLAGPLAMLMARRWQADAFHSWTGVDVVVCVPQRLWKRRARGYNPASLLAARFARAMGLPCRASMLQKTRWTPDQARIHTIPRRAANVAGAFTVPPRRTHRLLGRRVLLVDDVVTTGATASACSRALIEAGALEVVVLAAARTPRIILARGLVQPPRPRRTLGALSNGPD